MPAPGRFVEATHVHSSGLGAPLLPVTSQSGVRLPGRDRLHIVRRVFSELRERGRLELLLGGSVSNERGPRPQPHPQGGEVLDRVVRDAEMDQGASLRSISSSVDSHTARSNSGGGVGGSTNRLGWILTPVASPAYSVPSRST